MAIKKADGSIDIDATWEGALSRLSLRKPLPPFIQGNRAEPLSSITEKELQEQTRLLFKEVEAQCRYYTEKLGNDVMWVNDWLKMYWSAWSGGIDEELVRLTVREDCEYKDPLTFGRKLKGLQEFIDYNQAIFDAVPDLAYYLIPGQVSLQVSPKGDVIFMGRYTGSGHWDNPMRTYPFTSDAPAIPGLGSVLQVHGVDRYHFDVASRKVSHGETLWDGFDLLQVQGLMPSDTSFAFKAFLGLTRVVTPAIKVVRALRA